MVTKSTAIENQYSRIEESIRNATDIISPAWTLKSFVASNPLQGLEKHEFSDALKLAKEFFQADVFSKNLDIKKIIDLNKVNNHEIHDLISKKFAWAKEEIKAGSKTISASHFASLFFLNSKNKDSAKRQDDKLSQVFMHNFYTQIKEDIDKCLEPDYYQLYRSEKLIRKVNLKLIKFLELYFDEEQAYISMPGKENGFYLAWKAIAQYDNYKFSKRNEVLEFLENLSRDPIETIESCLKDFSIEEEDLEDFFRSCYASLPGWSSLIKWKQDYDSEDKELKTWINFVDLVAVRLCLNKIAFIENPQINKYEKNDKQEKRKHQAYIDELLKLLLEAGFDEKNLLETDSKTFKTLIKIHKDIKEARGLLLMEILENHFNESSKKLLNFDKELNSKTRADAQLVFCIDVRSEPFRRNLESLGQYETFGFAGFFGIPIEFQELESGKSCSSCPALIKPSHTVKEKIPAKQSNKALRRQEKNLLQDAFKTSLKDSGENIASLYSYAEISGAAYGLASVVKTLLPKQLYGFAKTFANLFNPKPDYELDLEHVKTKNSELGISMEDQYKYAKQALLMIGLVDNFAPMVVFAGHGSTTQNNPYSSALDCGACGGNHGGPNARALAQMLNNKEIQKQLKELDQIDIPADTKFLAAQHDTTTDDFEFFNNGQAVKTALRKRLRADLKKAKALNNSYRQLQFSTKDNARLRAYNWAETRPEWGLARNASFIIGPRELSKDLDLEGRSFLHSYDHNIDKNGEILETIMTAPMIVTQWINAQYLFSSINNVIFGSGSKITHNVLGKFAVSQGNASDLMHGLAMQSVKSSDEDLYHMPQRIINYIHAPKERVEKIVAKHEILQKLINNSWIKVVVMDPEKKEFFQL